jgi:AcrR family transcriptional regulator
MDKEIKAERRAGKRAQILDTARHLMISEGYEGLSLRKLASELRVTPTAIYFYFKSKEAIVRELCDDGLRLLLKNHLKLASIQNPAERLYRHGLVYLDFALTNTDYFWIMFVEPTFDHLEMDSNLQKGSLEEDSYAIGLNLAKQVVKQSKANVPAEKFMHSFWSMVHGIACLEISLKNEKRVKLSKPREQYRFSYDLLLKGLGIDREGKHD